MTDDAGPTWSDGWPSTDAALRSPRRTIALSDGVFAIALTVLVLTIRVPTPEELAAPGGLATALSDAWPFLVAYLGAFTMLSVTWLNHHAAFALITWVDNNLQWWNLGLLLAVSVMPVPTAFYASALAGGLFSDSARVFAVVFVLSSVARQVIWMMLLRYLRRHPELLSDGDGEVLRVDQRRAGLAVVVDVAAAALAFLVPVSAGVVAALIGLVFARAARSRMNARRTAAGPEPGPV